MSFSSYEKDMARMKPVFDKYRINVPLDTGITSPEGYSIFPDPGPPYILRASQFSSGTSPLYRNPTAQLYSQGSENQVLKAASDPQCSTGCLSGINNPDPRVFQVKPLYSPYAFKGTNLPTSYNVVGMY